MRSLLGWDDGVGEGLVEGEVEASCVGVLLTELEVLEGLETVEVDAFEVLRVLDVVEGRLLGVVRDVEEAVELFCESVLVLPKPWTPIIVCASPSGM